MATNKTTAYRQRMNQIISFIQSYSMQHGYSPSVREIGAAVGLSSSSSVQGYLNRLESEGIIERREDKPRTIKIVSNEHTDHGSNMTVPVVKELLFNGHMYDKENISGYRSIPQKHLPDTNVYVYYELADHDEVEFSDLQAHDMVLLSVGSLRKADCRALIKITKNGTSLVRAQRVDNHDRPFDAKEAYSMSKKLTKARSEKGLSVTQVINNMLTQEHTNVTEGQYEAWEKGHAIPNYAHTQALCNVLGISPEWLFGTSGESENDNDNVHIIGEIIGLSRSF